MSPAWKACNIFLKLFLGWEVSATDTQGKSGGLLCIWNPSLCDFKSYISAVGLLLTGCIKGIKEDLKILNVYGPYNDREPFWNRLAGSGLLRDPYLILVGDLNFTLSSS